MEYKIIVLAKQVPDTRNVGKDAMTEAGTVNRAALPAIFNPDDLLALEQALQIKEQNPEHFVTIFDGNQKIGRKLFATGNGRCNITNMKA